MYKKINLIFYSIFAFGAPYIKDKNRDDLHYWVCERQGQKEMRCTAMTTTICTGGQHKIRKFDA